MNKFQAQHKQRMTDYDYLIIGTGFGVSAAALRLAEKVWKLGMVEQGRRLTSADLRAGNPSLTITAMAERFAALQAYATPSLS